MQFPLYLLFAGRLSPPDGNKEGRKSFLSLEEIRRIVSGFAAMGTRKVRLTGGTLTAP